VVLESIRVTGAALEVDEEVYDGTACTAGHDGGVDEGLGVAVAGH
jgi:hypothetical protein